MAFANTIFRIIYKLLAHGGVFMTVGVFLISSTVPYTILYYCCLGTPLIVSKAAQFQIRG